MEWGGGGPAVEVELDVSALLDRFSAAFRRIVAAGERAGDPRHAAVTLARAASRLERTAESTEAWAASKEDGR